MNRQKQKPVIAVTGSRKINKLSITQFNITEFFTDGKVFQERLGELIADDVPYNCVYCKEHFTGCGVWVTFLDPHAAVSIHLAFSCRTCYREYREAKPAKAAKMQAKGIRRLFSIIAASEVKNS